MNARANFLEAGFLQADWAERVGWVLVHSLWQIALLATVYAAVMFILRKRSAAIRYVIGCVTLLAMLGVPTGTYILLANNAAPRTMAHVESAPAVALPPIDLAELPLRENQPLEPDVRAGELAGAPLELAPSESDTVAATGGMVLQDFLSPLRAYLRWATVAWLVGVLLLSLRPMWGWLHVRRLQRCGLSRLSESLERVGSRLMGRLDVQRAVRFAQSALVEVPTVVGYLRPLVLLPASAITGLGVSEIEMILAHELAHVRRHDYLVNLVQTVIEALLFYHPGMWWVSSQIRRERENCCDDIAVALCGNRASYVRALARLEEQRWSTPTAVLAATGGSLLTRVRRLLGQSPGEFDYRNATAGLAGLATSMVLIAAFLLGAMSRHPLARAEDDAAEKSESLNPQQIEQALADVYRRVTPAVVRVRSDDEGRRFTGQIGVIVSSDGYVVHDARQGPAVVRFELSDGRIVIGKRLGWSSQWNVGLSKIVESGPWPHVELAAANGIDVGQCIVGMKHPRTLSAREPVQGPLLLVDWVNRAAPGLWFKLSGGRVREVDHWQHCRVIFDLHGRLAGVVSRATWGGGITATDARVVKSLWDDLASGKNIDQLRFDKHGNSTKPVEPQRATADEIPRAVNRKVAAASVHIRSAADVQAGKKGWSGTIISADGLVATCAHHDELPGADVMVCLPDGRDLAGKVLGANEPCDIGLVQITNPGSVPYVEMGDSSRLRPGAPCLFAGYGPVPLRARHPLVRATKVVEPPQHESAHLLYTDPKTMFVGGDSGGGLFNAEGQLVAFHTGIGSPSQKPPRPHTNPRVELFGEHWDELHAPFDQSDESPLVAARDQLERSYRNAGGSIVEILNGEKQVGLGTIVDSSGLLIAKASNLPESFRCRLADGRVLPGMVVRTVREHDVAVIKIDAGDLTAVKWSAVDVPPIGSAVALAAADAAPVLGFVSHKPFAFPPEQGFLRANLNETQDGLMVEKIDEHPGGFHSIKIAPTTLHAGDIILSIGGHATPTREAYRKAEYRSLFKSGEPLVVAGDPCRLVVKRGDKQMELREIFAPRGFRFAGQTPRSSGFPRVLSVNTNATTEMCGGPVIDRSGRAIGIAIGWRHGGWLFVLPADIARSITRDKLGRQR